MARTSTGPSPAGLTALGLSLPNSFFIARVGVGSRAEEAVNRGEGQEQVQGCVSELRLTACAPPRGPGRQRSAYETSVCVRLASDLIQQSLCLSSYLHTGLLYSACPPWHQRSALSFEVSPDHRDIFGERLAVNSTPTRAPGLGGYIMALGWNTCMQHIRSHDIQRRRTQ